MRKISDVCYDYGKYLRDEGKINLTDIELEELSNTDDGQKMLLDKLDEELLDYEIYDGQKVSSLKAFKLFCKIVVKEDIASGMGVWNDFVRMQFELVERNTLTCYLAARGHGKSYFANLYLIFKMYIIESYDILITFNIPKMIRRFFRVYRRIIDNNEFLLRKKDTRNMKTLVWGQTECEFNNGLISGMTLGSTPRSAHVNIIWTDDLLRADNKYTKEYIKNYVLGELMPCIRRKKGRFVVEGCVVGDTLVINSDGESVPISQYDKGKKGQTELNQSFYGEGGYHNAVKFHNNGYSKTIKVKTKFGYDIEVTPQHPLRVVKGDWKYRNIIWKRAEELSLGDKVIIQTSKDIFGKRNIHSEKAYLLGLYTAEGSYEHTGNYRMTITNTEFDKIKPNLNLKWTSNDGVHNRACSKELYTEFIKFGLNPHQKCYEKTVPLELFKCNKETISNYLKGLFDGDGCCSNNKVCLHSTSEKLLKQVQQLLLKFGVICSVKKAWSKGKYSKKCGYSKYDCYVLHIIKETLHNFKDIGFRLKRKQDKMNEIDLRQTKQSHKSYYNQMYPVSITSLDEGYAETFDFVIPETHSFNSNGFISHNTPFDETDIYHYLFQDKSGKVKRSLLLCTHSGLFKSARGWACRIFPAILDHKTKKVLVPEAFSYDEIMAEKDKIGEYRWYREFMCKCEINKAALISYYLFMKNIDEKETLQEVGEEGSKYVMFVDPSAGEGEESDYAAIVVVEKAKGKVILRYVWHERLLPIIDPEGGNVDLTHKVMRVNKDFKDCELWVENNSIGRILIQNLRNNNVDPYEHNTKEDKIDIIMEAVSMLKGDSNVVIPYHPECSYTQEWIPILRNECTNFGIKKKGDKLVAGATSGHDDMFIAFVMALNYASEANDGGVGVAGAITQD